MDSEMSTTRRQYLLGAGSLAATSTTGCLQALGFSSRSAWADPPLVEDPPTGVYVPAITEGMLESDRHVGPELEVSLMYSYPHRFWTAAGTKMSKTPVQPSDDVHLMISMWHRDTGQSVPIDAGVRLEIRQEDTLVTDEVAYPMLSQQMGFHYGANYSLNREGTYHVTVHLGSLSLPRSGEFDGILESPTTVPVTLEFDRQTLADIEITERDDAGEPGAVEPMSMDGVPVGRAPSPERLPGNFLTTAHSADAVFEIFHLVDPPFGEMPYLYASVHTPYNHILVPMMGLEYSIETTNGQTIEGTLERRLDSTLGYHYGGSIPALESGGLLRIHPTIPPQVARHDGYETAFRQMTPIETSI
jgi:hypothetical protein